MYTWVANNNQVKTTAIKKFHHIREKKKKGQLMKLSSHTTMVIESFSVLEEFGHNNLGPFFTVPSSPTGKNKSNKTKQAELN